MMLFRRTPAAPKCIGLALSGGAVRGAAHVGVLQVLEREGIQPAVVAGTSVGALVGAAVAAGRNADELSQIFHTIRWPKLTRISLGRFMGLLDTGPFERVFGEIVGHDRIETLPTPFGAVACDLLTGEEVVFHEGPVGRILRASAAVPGVFPPVELDGRLLVDGCVVNNLPVDAARSMGADYVIAVDLVPPPSGGRRPRNALEVMMISAYLWSRANHPAHDSVDAFIVPDIAEYLGWDFDDVPELEARGRAAAELLVPQLRRDLGLDVPKGG